MKNAGRMKRFRRIVRELVDNEDFSIDRPRAMFLKAFMLFKKTEGLLKHALSDKEHQQLREVFVRTLKREGVKIKEGLLDTGDFKKERSVGFSTTVTAAMLRGAREAEFRHRQILGSDY